MEIINCHTFEMSATIAELAKGLATAQGAIESAIKDKENPHFKSSYADLASVWDACRKPLSSNGLAVIQMPRAEEGLVSVTTMLTHSSGEWMRSELTLKASKLDAQGIGSAITYARRYSLSAMVGVAPDDDDDGNAVSQPVKKPAAVVATYPYKGTEPQKKFLNSLCEKKGVPLELRAKVHQDFIAAGIISNPGELNKAIDKFMEGQG